MLTFSQIGRNGRFANQIFQLAGTIAIANKSGQPFAFPAWKNHDALERFGTTEDIDVQKYFVNELPLLPDMPGFLNSFQSVPYFWGYQDLHLPTGNWDLSVLHFQSEKYWHGSEQLIRFYMTMKDEPADYIDATALHVRHGDYSGWNEGYHPRCSVDYYRAALAHVTNEIYLFSDDIPGASAMMNEIGVKYTVIDKGYIESFAIMKKCKNFITANSSYSMAAAYLSEHPEKKVIAPSQWFGPAFGPDMTAKDIYPQNCIVI